MRYTLEFLADVYPQHARPVVKRLIALQDLLGLHQDADVAIERLRLLARRAWQRAAARDRVRDGRDRRALPAKRREAQGAVPGRVLADEGKGLESAADGARGAPPGLARRHPIRRGPRRPRRRSWSGLIDVFLVRHAIAENRDQSRWPDDSVRPLTPEGEQRFRRAARGLRRIVPDVDLVLSSPYTRAWHTAEILNEEAGWPRPERCEALEAVRGPDDVVEALRQQSDRASVALVGHEPQLSSLASILVAGDEHVVMFDKKKGGVAFLSFPGDPAPGEAILRWWVPPKILRLLDA